MYFLVQKQTGQSDIAENTKSKKNAELPLRLEDIFPQKRKFCLIDLSIYAYIHIERDMSEMFCVISWRNTSYFQVTRKQL